ncbi:LysR family transcriptional regulator (plasmid) [Lichenicola cladoniae]|uniref:LysR family transcriptional regulator n=1 Tax=Lichenicola cladoniae TaxID=1484109 RepID=A0A6M8HZX6_9PROT|nr:LysR family transcriptional regulator [Lichenicola cladoniae]NPD70009.1 LysR family transcriptional regulator [Acetobacteraceae bacterium]QKE93631.1 LysR family transcriptional regulator [Lichenicola cladoniae]
MNWEGLDLNLLAVFEAVMQERNLTRAGQRLGLSQPAVSHALGRLRQQIGDELLVRGPDGMVPTARAEQLAGPVREALASLRIALATQAAHPGEMRGPFTMSVNGYTAFVLAGRLIAGLRDAAPHLKLTLLPSGTRNVLDELDAGVIDLALTRMPDGGDRFKCAAVLTDHFVTVLRREHPALQGRLTLQDLAALDHMTITSTGDNTSFLDEALEANGLQRRIALSVPFLSAAELLGQSDLIAVMPARVAAHLGAGLEVRALPCAGPPVDLWMTWHRRRDGDAEQLWVRDTIRSCLQAIGREGPFISRMGR